MNDLIQPTDTCQYAIHKFCDSSPLSPLPLTSPALTCISKYHKWAWPSESSVYARVPSSEMSQDTTGALCACSRRMGLLLTMSQLQGRQMQERKARLKMQVAEVELDLQESMGGLVMQEKEVGLESQDIKVGFFSRLTSARQPCPHLIHAPASAFVVPTPTLSLPLSLTAHSPPKTSPHHSHKHQTPELPLATWCLCPLPMTHTNTRPSESPLIAYCLSPLTRQNMTSQAWPSRMLIGSMVSASNTWIRLSRPEAMNSSPSELHKGRCGQRQGAGCRVLVEQTAGTGHQSLVYGLRAAS